MPSWRTSKADWQRLTERLKWRKTRVSIWLLLVIPGKCLNMVHSFLLLMSKALPISKLRLWELRLSLISWTWSMQVSIRLRSTQELLSLLPWLSTTFAMICSITYWYLTARFRSSFLNILVAKINILTLCWTRWILSRQYPFSFFLFLGVEKVHEYLDTKSIQY